MHTQFTIFKKGLTLIAVPLLVQAVFIAVLVRAQAEHVRAQDMAVHTKEVIAKVQELHRTLVEGYAGIRGLIYSADTAAGRDRAIASRVPAEVDELRALVADNSRQTPRIAALAARCGAFVGWIADEDRLVGSGARDRALAEVGRGGRLLDELRATIAEIRGEEEGLDRQRMEALRSSSARQVWTLVGGGAAIVASTLILALLFLQGIIQRLAVLRDNARRFGEGKPLNPPLSGRDEITEVDRAFHDMADNLGQQKQENEMFVYSVSHDLRSPLVNLQGFSEELSLSCRDLRELFRRDDVPEAVRRRGAQLMDRDVEESIRFIQAAVGRLARIIDALLRLSRAGRVEYQWQEVDVAATVGKVVAALHDTISAKGAQVAVGELPPAWGDPTAVERVFANLIGNAVQYLDPERPGRIEIEGVEPDGAGLPPGLRVYRVRDNGLGIPEAYHQRMFTAFSRFHAGVTQGEGIGLALVRRMVERHGGRIWLESSAGAGTTFFVALPVSPADGPGAAGGNGTRPQAAAAPPPAHPESRGDRQPWAPSPS
jgi:signal transduction histidine kinase